MLLLGCLVGDWSLQNIVQLAVETTRGVVLAGRACLWGGAVCLGVTPPRPVEGEEFQWGWFLCPSSALGYGVDCVYGQIQSASGRASVPMLSPCCHCTQAAPGPCAQPPTTVWYKQTRAMQRAERQASQHTT